METILILASLVILFIILPVILLKLIQRIGMPRKLTAEEQKREADERLERLLNPDFTAMRKYLGSEIPANLIELYNDKNLIQKKDFEVSVPDDPENAWSIAEFIPAHPKDYEYTWEDVQKMFCFASSPFGDPYYIDISSADLAVYIYYHDGGDTARVANSLQDFKNAIR